MDENPFTPRDLPLLAPSALLRSLDWYRDMLAVMGGHGYDPEAMLIRRQVEAAVRAIEAGLHARGQENKA